MKEGQREGDAGEAQKLAEVLGELVPRLQAAGERGRVADYIPNSPG